ncbi:MAG: SH3 domain-containing protein [Proteobacteria bacterium]|nr:SH3 domain-containing protein [Pseudomonadota bacterium]MBU1688775.1 SH3 domain-containing protein [Pseudomonadota bacterium]
MKKMAIGFLVVLFLVSVCEAITMVSINGAKVNMRSGPGENYSVLWELGNGFPLKRISEQKNWVKVEDFEGDVGWVYGKLISKEPHFIVKKKRINIRSSPSSKSKVVGKANYGVVFKTLEQKNGWVKVKHENGLTGWISRSLVWGW